MDRYESAFIILYAISSIDGEINVSETELIMKFLKENREEIKFDHRALIGTMVLLSEDELKEKLNKAAQEFKNLSTEEERLKLLNFALNLVISDGRIDANEIRMFNILGKVWEIDIDKFIDYNFQRRKQ